MPTKGSVPVVESEVISWISHLAARIETYATVLAVTSDDVKTLKADAAMVVWVTDALPAIRASAQQFTSFKDSLLDQSSGGPLLITPTLTTLDTPPGAVSAGVISRTRSLVQRIKKSPAYTDAIGKDLGIIGAEVTADVMPKPKFKAIVLPNFGVRLDWTKAGHSGVAIHCKRTGDADWVALGRDNYSPYLDERTPVAAGVSETRQYRMRYVDKDAEVGEWSDVVVVVATP